MSSQRDDSAALEDLFGDSEVMRFGAGVQSQSWVRSWIEKRQTDYELHGFGLWGVVDVSGGELIGYCGLTDFPNIDGRHEVELGYRLIRRHWGRGIATEAARAVRDHAINVLGLTRLIALIDPDNTASIRVAEKIGMQYEKEAVLPGYDHPDLVYALGSLAQV